MGGNEQEMRSASGPDARPQPIGKGGWVFVAIELAVGSSALGLAASPEFAMGKAAFASDAWRYILGGFGACLLAVAAWGITRLVGGAMAKYDPQTIARRRKIGAVFGVVGIGFILNALPPIADRTVAFSSWPKVLFIGAGIQFTIIGMASQINVTKSQGRDRVRRGQGRHGTATIVRADDTGMLVNDRPQVKIEFTIEVAGAAPYQAEDKIVMQQAKLALLIPGSTVDVTVDETDPAIFHIDWDSWRAPS